jgi:1-acyl-sn-glycerol-3-phosphate acyltransferase
MREQSGSPSIPRGVARDLRRPYLLIVLYTIFWGTLGCVIGLVDRSGDGVIWVGRSWISWILATCGIDVEASGLDRLDTARPYVLMSNHQSVFDIAAIVTTTARRFPTRGLRVDDRSKLKDAVRAAIERGIDHQLQAEPAREHAA